MKGALKAVEKAAKRILGAATALYRRYPARANSYILAGVFGGAGALGIVVDPESAATVIKTVVPVLLAGEATHRLVSPAR
jgi:hypothetical protein